ncbi:hypothetical protein [Conchiformibius steedae]|uniref:hypothetical protein n=1 Tax=Conchiformibius steedae TaxID=153493 RepID=UPI0011D032D2|nr:hypothetical protein [Conchiformibius steedae]
MRRKFSPFPPNTEGLSLETPMDTANSLHWRFAFLIVAKNGNDTALPTPLCTIPYTAGVVALSRFYFYQLYIIYSKAAVAMPTAA